ncbi:MAG: hypothetical protein AAF998_11700 [Bacteroidota bacterium]
MNRAKLIRFTGLIVVELALLGFAWYPGRFIYRTIYVYDQAAILRPMEWLAFLFPLACLLALPVVAWRRPKFWVRYAGWVLIGTLSLNFLLCLLKLGWFFAGL